MRQITQHREARTATTGLTFPIKLRCASIADLCAEPGLEVALTRALARAFGRARTSLPPRLVTGGGVVLTAPTLVNHGQVTNGDAPTILVRVRRAIEAAARAQSLFQWATANRPTTVEPGKSPVVTERFDPNRFEPNTTTYDLPSYDGGRKLVVVTSFTDAAHGDDGLHIASGHEADFWRGLRSMLFIKVQNGQGIPERNEAIRILLQGIRRQGAQILIREALDHPVSGVRIELIDALGKIKHDQTLAWQLLLYGLERPGDLLGYGPLDKQLDTDAAPLIKVLVAALEGTDEPYRANAARFIRHYLEGQFDGRNTKKRRAYDLLRTVAARFDLYGKGPLGADATRDRVARAIDVLIDTTPVIVDPLTPTTPYETAQTNDEHILDPYITSMKALKAALPFFTPDALTTLDTRITGALEMALVLPDRIQNIQNAIRVFARALRGDPHPSDEVVALQQLRRRYLLAFVSASTSDSAIESFKTAERNFADLRNVVADIKFARLAVDFKKARELVDTASGMPLLRMPSDPSFTTMKELLARYTQALSELLMPLGVGTASFQVSRAPVAASYESAVQTEIDLNLYKILATMFLYYAASLRYEQDVNEQEIGSAKWRILIKVQTHVLRSKILKYWNHENYRGFLDADLQQDLDHIDQEIQDQQKYDRNLKTAILLAATLVAGVAGILVRTALLGTLLEATAGATRLAVSTTVVLTEATAFTATQVGLEHLAFGKSVTLGGFARELGLNVAQFAAFGALSRFLGPMGASGPKWLAFVGKHATGLALQFDIGLLTREAQGRGFSTDVGNFLVETIGAYAIGATTSHIAGEIQNEAVAAHIKEVRSQGAEILRRGNAALRSGELDSAGFDRLKHDLIAWLGKVDTLNDFLLSSKTMTKQDHAAALDVINQLTDRIAHAKFQPGRPYSGPLLLEAAKVPGLVKVGSTELYRYDPRRPPTQLQELARSYQRVGSLDTSFENGTLTVREVGSRRLVLLIGPGPVPAGLLPEGAPSQPPRHPPTFIESASGGHLTPAGIAASTAIINGINRNALPELQSRGDAGRAGLSLLLKYRFSLKAWPIASVRGLAIAFEAPRAISKANLERFFSLPSADTADAFGNFQAIADMPGANLVLSQPSLQDAITLIGMYRELRSLNLSLPPDMNESALRGLLAMRLSMGPYLTLEAIRNLSVGQRLAEFMRFDPRPQTPGQAVARPEPLLTPLGQPTRAGIAFVRQRFGDQYIHTGMNPRRVSDLSDAELSQQFSHEWKWVEDSFKEEVGAAWQQLQQDAAERGTPYDPRIDFVLLQGTNFNSIAARLQAAARFSGHTVTTDVLAQNTGAFLDELIQHGDPAATAAFNRGEQLAREALQKRRTQPPTRGPRPKDFADHWREALADLRANTNGTKRPDILEVMLSRNQLVVSDPTLAYDDPAHNLKLAVYRAISARLINAQVGAIDIRSLFRHTLAGP